MKRHGTSRTPSTFHRRLCLTDGNAKLHLTVRELWWCVLQFHIHISTKLWFSPKPTHKYAQTHGNTAHRANHPFRRKTRHYGDAQNFFGVSCRANEPQGIGLASSLRFHTKTIVFCIEWGWIAATLVAQRLSKGVVFWFSREFWKYYVAYD